MIFRWRVKVEREYYGRAVTVNLVRRFQIHSLTISTVMVAGDDFDQKLAEAIAEARQRAIALNGGIRHAERRLPRG